MFVFCGSLTLLTFPVQMGIDAKSKGGKVNPVSSSCTKALGALSLYPRWQRY